MNGANLLVAEATSLIQLATRYQVTMNQLPAADTRRDVYAMVIRDLLERAQRMCLYVGL